MNQMFHFWNKVANDSHPEFHQVFSFKGTKMSCLPFSSKIELVYCCIWQGANGEFKDNGGNLNNNILTDGSLSFMIAHSHTIICSVSALSSINVFGWLLHQGLVWSPSFP